MQKNLVRIAAGSAGILFLVVLAVTGFTNQEKEQTVHTDNKFHTISMAVSLAGRPEFLKREFEQTLEKKKELLDTENVPEVNNIATPAVTGMAFSAPEQQEVIQPMPQPNVQVVVAAPQPEEEPAPQSDIAQVPVEAGVSAPGNVQVGNITVSLQTPQPETTQNSSVFSQEDQMASIQGGCTIMGTSYTYMEQMIRYFKANQSYPDFYANSDAPTIEAFCQIYLEEAAAEGVRAEVAFCQAMKETGFLRYKGDVKIEQYNFAGIGATGGGEPGNSFGTVRTGVRAQIQHLKAYASKDALNGVCVDPRFSYIRRGTTPYVDWLGIKENPNGGGWAAAENYGSSIINDYLAKLFSY